MDRGSNWIVHGLVILVLCLAALSMFAGDAALSFKKLWQGILGSDPYASIIVREIRFPRTLLALGVGATLGLCGAAAQSLTRNPLAEPAVFGTPQAAAFGAVAVLYSGFASALSIWLPLAAITLALISLLAIWAILRRNASIVSVLLVGLALGSLSGAATSMVLSFSKNPYAIMEIVFWLMGSFEDRSMQHVYLSFPFFVLAAFMIAACRQGYQLLALGEDVARSMGVSLNRIAFLTACAIAIGVGAGVAVSGAIGFVGLVTPHMVRPFFRGNPSRVLLPAALAGACLTIAADIAVRLLPSASEMRVGVLTAFIGVPWFVYLVVSNRGFVIGEQAR